MQREQGERLRRQFVVYTRDQRAGNMGEARYWLTNWRTLAAEAIDALRAVEAALRKK